MSNDFGYIQTTDLQNQIDWDAIMPMDRYAGGHDDQMRGLFKSAEIVAHYNTGDYQGSVATCVKLVDGRIAIYNDYYGSCSGCDSWEGAGDEEVRKMCIDLSNSAYVFPDMEKTIAFLKAATDGDIGNWSRWNGCASGLLTAIEAQKP